MSESEEQQGTGNLRKVALAATGLLLVTVVLCAWWLRNDAEDQEAVAAWIPAAEPDDDFATAQACRECHPNEHASWHDSWHRTMTQVVSPETVLGDFDDVHVTLNDRPYHFFQTGETFQAEMPDPEPDAGEQIRELLDEAVESKPVRRQVVMSTGSHHYQAYWINSRSGNRLLRLPWVFHRAEDRWLPARDVFVTPPTDDLKLAQWNTSCIQCHAVHGQPGFDERTNSYSTRVAEFGIACESCHGPGRKHVEHHRTAGHDSSTARSPEGDETIVNPSRLSHIRASQVCGQCHSDFSFGDSEFFQTGFKYRPGDDLNETRYIHQFEDNKVQSRPDLMDGYWLDGTMRIGGREFSAMDDSKCFLEGELSCLSCHSMHNYASNDDQLRPADHGAASCLNCHDEFADDPTAHTHHAADSAGSNCLNCHMPKTSFGLLKAIRSHRIDSPSVAMMLNYERPTACNLCHLDKTLEWTSGNLAKWYGHEDEPLSAELRNTSASLLFLLTGDAVQRAVTAASFGREEAHKASGTHWQVPSLARLLEDPYAAVRYSASKALVTYPGFEDFEYDFIGKPETWTAARNRAIAIWEEQNRNSTESTDRRVLIAPDGKPMTEQIESLLELRNDRPVELPE